MITYISTTYLKNVSKYIYYQYTEPDMHIVIKKILKTEPFTLNENGREIKILDNNYYVMEIIPMNTNYICRIHLDDNKRIIERFYIMTLKKQFINNLPTFIDLKTSYVICDFQMKKYREEYLNDLVSENVISQKEYKLVKKEFYSLIKEIKNGKNKIFNMDYKETIEMIERY